MDPTHFLDGELDRKWYPERDYHRIFIGEIVEVLKKTDAGAAARGAEDGMTENETKQAKNRAVLVGLNAHCLSAEENADDTSMEELADLLETAGGVCVGTVFQNKDAPIPAPSSARAKAAEVKELVGAMGADMVVVDNPLSPPSSGCCRRNWASRCWTGRP